MWQFNGNLVQGECGGGQAVQTVDYKVGHSIQYNLMSFCFYCFSLLLSSLPVVILWLNLQCLADVVAASCVTAKHKDDEEGGSLPRSHQEFFCCVMLLFVNSFLLSLVQNKAIVKL